MASSSSCVALSVKYGKAILKWTTYTAWFLVLPFYAYATHTLQSAIPAAAFAILFAGVLVLVLRPPKGKVISYVTQHFVYEFSYQLCLTLIASIMWVIYTHYLDYAEDADGVLVYTRNLPNTNRFYQVECFLFLSYSIDYGMKLYIHVEKFGVSSLLFKWVDLCAFTGIAYAPVFQAWLPYDSPVDIYLITGPFRLARLRRSLGVLDRVTDRLLKLGPWVITPLQSQLAKLILNLLLFISISASIVLIAEYPCAAYSSPVITNCQPQLKGFGHAIYFIIVTMSTVGYGDLYAATPVGRVIMTFIIVFALASVPVQVNKMADLWDRRNEVPKEVVTVEELVQAPAAEPKKEDDKKKRRAVGTRRDAITTDGEEERWHMAWNEMRMLRHTLPSQRRALATFLGIHGTDEELPSLLLKWFLCPSPPLPLAYALAASTQYQPNSHGNSNGNSNGNGHTGTIADAPRDWVPSDVTISPDNTLPLRRDANNINGNGGNGNVNGGGNTASYGVTVTSIAPDRDGGAQHHEPVLLHFHDDGQTPDMLQAPPVVAAEVPTAAIPSPEHGPRGTHFSPLVSVTQILRQRSQADLQPMYTSDL